MDGEQVFRVEPLPPAQAAELLADRIARRGRDGTGRPRARRADLHPARRAAARARARRRPGARARPGRAARRARRAARLARPRPPHGRTPAPVAARRRRLVLRVAGRRAARAVRPARGVRRARWSGRRSPRSAATPLRCPTSWSGRSSSAGAQASACSTPCERSPANGWRPTRRPPRCARGMPPGCCDSPSTSPPRGHGPTSPPPCAGSPPTSPRSGARTGGCARTARWRISCGSGWSAPSWATSRRGATSCGWPTTPCAPRAAIPTRPGPPLTQRTALHPLLPRLLGQSAGSRWQHGDVDGAERRSRRAIALADHLGDPLLARKRCEMIANTAQFSGDLPRAAEYGLRSAELSRAAGDDTTLADGADRPGASSPPTRATT